MPNDLWLDPALVFDGPAGGTIVFAGDVPIGWRRTQRLSVGTESITWGDQTICLAEITAVAYGARPCMVNVFHHAVERTVRLMCGQTVHELSFGRQPVTNEQTEEAYGAMVDVLHNLVEPRLRGELLAQLGDRGSVRVAGLRLSGEGLTLLGRFGGDRLLPWDALPSASIEGPDLLLWANQGGERSVVLSLPTLDFDAVLLPELLEATLTPTA